MLLSETWIFSPYLFLSVGFGFLEWFVFPGFAYLVMRNIRVETMDFPLPRNRGWKCGLFNLVFLIVLEDVYEVDWPWILTCNLLILVNSCVSWSFELSEAALRLRRTPFFILSTPTAVLICTAAPFGLVGIHYIRGVFDIALAHAAGTYAFYCIYPIFFVCFKFITGRFLLVHPSYRLALTFLAKWSVLVHLIFFTSFRGPYWKTMPWTFLSWDEAFKSVIMIVTYMHSTRYMSLLPRPDFADEDDKMCTICREETLTKENSKMHICCRSVFHESCLKQWLIVQFTCPMCRKKATDILTLQIKRMEKEEQEWEKMRKAK